jgi:hypothetical protein
LFIKNKIEFISVEECISYILWNFVQGPLHAGIGTICLKLLKIVSNIPGIRLQTFSLCCIVFPVIMLVVSSMQTAKQFCIVVFDVRSKAINRNSSDYMHKI